MGFTYVNLHVKIGYKYHIKIKRGLKNIIIIIIYIYIYIYFNLFFFIL